jgi:protein involved in polysaccharide export with SLBB domain
MLLTVRKHLAALTYLALTLWSLALWGCAGTHSSHSAVPGNLVIGRNVSSVAPPEYRIGALDELEIRVRYHERLNVLVKVRPDGRITLEDIGDLYVAGMTPSQLDSAITDLYSSIIHEPEVTVFVRSFADLSIYVVGEVRDAGIVEMKPKMTILQAVAAARGPVRGAQMSSVMLLRRDAAGQINAIRLDLNSSAVKNAAYQDIYVQPEDIIFVPKTFIASVNNFLTQVYDGLFPPVDIYLRALREYNRNNPN